MPLSGVGTGSAPASSAATQAKASTQHPQNIVPQAAVISGGAPGSKPRTYDLSEAKMLAQQTGGWSLSPSSAAPATAPPGLPRSALPSPSAGSTAVPGSNAAHGLKSPATSAQQQFGFSQFDILASAAAPSPFPATAQAWVPSTATAPAGGPSLGSLTASLSGQQRVHTTAYSAATDVGAGLYESPSYLGDLINFLDSSRTASTGAAAASTGATSTATTATTAAGTTYYNGALYADSGYYGGQDEGGLEAYDMVEDSYYDAYSADNFQHAQQYGGASSVYQQDYAHQFGADSSSDGHAGNSSFTQRSGRANAVRGSAGMFHISSTLFFLACVLY